MTNQNSPLANWTTRDRDSDAEGGNVEHAPEKRKFISPLNLFARRQQAIPPAAEAPHMDENDTISSQDLADFAAEVAEQSANESAAESAENTVESETEAVIEDFSSDMQFIELDDLEAELAAAEGLTRTDEPEEDSVAAEEQSATEIETVEMAAEAEPVTPVAEAKPSPEPLILQPAPASAETPDAKEEKVEPAVTPAAAVEEAPARRSSRVKTTFLGFERSDGRIEDVFERARDTTAGNNVMFPVGWIVIVDGPGRGGSFTLQAGVSQIGRGDDQAVQLNFGDNGISRSNHAAIAYDDEERKFFLGHGGKSNIVRLNGKPVLSTEPLEDGDRIRIGETTLVLVAFCGADFQWNDQN